MLLVTDFERLKCPLCKKGIANKKFLKDQKALESRRRMARLRETLEEEIALNMMRRRVAP
jgi:hypothetical protein